MNFADEFEKIKQIIKKQIENFFSVGAQGKDKLNVRFYLVAHSLTEVLGDMDCFTAELSRRIEACDSVDGASSLPELQRLFARVCEARRICEELLSTCESALAEKHSAEAKIHSIAKTAIYLITLL